MSTVKNSNLNIPVLYRFGTKANKGLLQPSNLISVLEESKKVGLCVKRDEKGHSYWMWNNNQSTFVEAGKYPGFESWNGFHNIDIDLKDLFCKLGLIDCKRNKSYPEILDFHQFSDMMKQIKSILDKCLQQFFQVAFVTGSRCGFNYVCKVLVIDDEGNEKDLKNEEMYNYSFAFIISKLKQNLQQVAEKHPDESSRELAKLLLENEKAIDETAGQLNRMKFCGADDWWANPVLEKYGETLHKFEYDEKLLKSLKNNNYSVEKHLAGVLSNIDCTKIEWNWETRIAIGYSAPAVFGSKEKALEWAQELNIPENDSKDRKSHLISIIKSWNSSNYKTKLGEDLIKKLLMNDSKLLEKLDTKTNQNDFELSISKYLSEEVSEIFSICEEFKKIGVCAPTGFGKTRMIIELAKKYNEIGKRIVFLVPLNSIKQDSWNDVKNDSISIHEMLLMNKLDNNWTYVSASKNDRRNYDPWKDANKNIIAVYDSGIQKVIPNIDSTKTVLVVDESHTIVTTGYRSEIMPKMFELISDWTSNLILLSATPNYEFSKINKRINAVRKNDVVRHAELIPFNSKNDFSVIKNTVEKRDKESILIFYFDFANKKLVEDVKKLCKENEGFNLYAKPETTQVDEIRKNGWIENCKVLFISAYGAAGINLYPKQLTDIVCLTEDAGTAIQSCSRVRNYENIKSIKLFVKSDTTKFFSNPLIDYWNGIARNYSELAEMYDVLNALSLDRAPKLNDKVFYKDPEKTKFNDFVDAITKKNTEISSFIKYAKANNIELSIRPEQVFDNNCSGILYKMNKKVVFDKITEEEWEELKKQFSTNQLKLAKKINYNFIQTGFFKELFENLDESFYANQLKKLYKIIRLSCRSDHWSSLIFYLTDFFRKMKNEKVWKENKWELIQDWFNTVLTNKKIDSELVQNKKEYFYDSIYNVKQVALFVLSNLDLFEKTFELRFKLEKENENSKDELLEFLGLPDYEFNTNYDAIDAIAYGEEHIQNKNDIKVFNSLVRFNLDQNNHLIDPLMINQYTNEKPFDCFKTNIQNTWNEIGEEWTKKQNKMTKSSSGTIGGKASKKGTGTGKASKKGTGTGKASKKGTGTGKASKNFKTYLCVEYYTYKKGGKSLKEFNAFKGETYTVNDLTNKGISRPTALKILKSGHFKEQ